MIFLLLKTVVFSFACMTCIFANVRCFLSYIPELSQLLLIWVVSSIAYLNCLPSPIHQFIHKLPSSLDTTVPFVLQHFKWIPVIEVGTFVSINSLIYDQQQSSKCSKFLYKRGKFMFVGCHVWVRNNSSGVFCVGKVTF